MSTLADIEAARERLSEWRRTDPKASLFPLGDLNWTYDGDNHVPAVEPLPVMIMGLNAGAGNGATPTRLSGSELRWRTRCSQLAAGFGQGERRGRFVMAELIPLGSFDQKQLRAGYGDLTPAIAAGADANLAVIFHHRPQIIFQTGIDEGQLAIIAEHYGLMFVDARPRPDHPTHTLLKHYRMGDGTPWLAIMHFARFGFSKRDMEAIRSYAAGALFAGSSGAE